MYRVCRVGQNHTHTVYVRYFWQGIHQIYDHIRCIYTALANLRTCRSVCSGYLTNHLITFRLEFRLKMQLHSYR
jgi:pyridoxal/pyridoxine/pyridoxamine kinase